ncbi:unnamed protein product, partial [Clonostachys chloroleuca]
MPDRPTTPPRGTAAPVALFPSAPLHGSAPTLDPLDADRETNITDTEWRAGHVLPTNFRPIAEPSMEFAPPPVTASSIEELKRDVEQWKTQYKVRPRGCRLRRFKDLPNNVGLSTAYLGYKTTAEYNQFLDVQGKPPTTLQPGRGGPRKLHPLSYEDSQATSTTFGLMSCFPASAVLPTRSRREKIPWRTRQ